MSTESLHWPDEHVAWQNVIAADPEMSVPFAVHVFIFHTIEQLQAACEDPEANAHSMTHVEVDDAGVGAVVMLAKPELHLSIVAHEAAHIALLHQAHIMNSRIGARRWLHEHPEYIAQMIGNLTAILWYGTPTAEELG